MTKKQSEQCCKFKEKARELNCDESVDAFDEKLRRIANQGSHNVRELARPLTFCRW